MGLLDFTDEFEEVFEKWDGQIGAPTPENGKKSRISVYKNSFIENYLATSHPALPGVWFGGFIAYGLYAAVTLSEGPVIGLALYALGIILFSLMEYWLHRVAFHWPAGETRTGRMRLFLMHGYHHQFPNDPWRLVAPPLLSWPLAVVVFAFYWFTAGPEWAWVLFGGTTASYLAYDWIHYYTHHVRNPTSFIGKRLRRAHAVHHYKLFEYNMGISSPLWDYVFRTGAWSPATQKEALAASRRVEAQTDAPAESESAPHLSSK